MTSDCSGTKTSSLLLWLGYLCAVLLLLAVHAAFIHFGISPILHGDMPDSDTYMRLVRVEAFATGQEWLDSSVVRMNAPYGDILNWTRPLDMLILAGAYPLQRFAEISLHDAIFWSGSALPVVLHLLLGVTVVWAFSPLLPRRAGPLLFLLSTLQPVMLAYNMAGRPDQQTLLLICMVLMLGGLLREIKCLGAAPMSWSVWAGLCAGFGLWISPEFQFALLIMTATLGLWWALSGEREVLHAVEGLSLGFFIVVAIGVLAERGTSWNITRELDKISLSHALAAAVNCGVWGFMPAFSYGGRMKRFIGLAVLGALGVAGLVFFAPELLRGPAGDIDPRVLSEFLLSNREMRPLWPVDLNTTALMLIWLGTPLTALVLWPRLGQGWGRQGFALLWPLVLAFTVFGLLHARFAQFAAPLGAVMLVVELFALTTVQLLPRVILQMAFLIGPVFVGLLLVEGDKEAETTPCSVHQAAAALNTLPTGIIMAYINYGPELLYRTSHSVVSGPYHRNRDGILDSFDFFRTGDRQILKRRGVAYVLACAGDSAREKDAHFMADLAKGKHPAWLSPVEGKDFGSFFVYRVKP